MLDTFIVYEFFKSVVCSMNLSLRDVKPLNEGEAKFEFQNSRTGRFEICMLTSEAD